MKWFRVEFKRVGRNHSVAPMLVHVADIEELGDLIYRHARPHLRSRDVEVTYNEEEGRGYLVVGLVRNGGEFTFTEVRDKHGSPMPA